MKLTLEVKGRILHALSADALELLEGLETVVDLRRAHEVVGDPIEGAVRHPFTPASLSEQDMDHLRREFARGRGPCALVSTGGRRAAAVVLMHAARTQGWSAEEALEKCPDIRQEPALERFLRGYLERHRNREYREERGSGACAPCISCRDDPTRPGARGSAGP